MTNRFPVIKSLANPVFSVNGGMRNPGRSPFHSYFYTWAIGLSISIIALDHLEGLTFGTAI